MPVFRAECDYNFDPPMVKVFADFPPPVGTQFITSVPIGDYESAHEAFGFPDIVCNGPA